MTFQDTVRNLDWRQFDQESDPNVLWDIFYNHIISALNDMCPLRNIKVSWLTDDILALMRDRDFYYSRAYRYNSTDDWNQAKFLRNRVAQAINNHKINSLKINHNLERNKNVPRKFWNNIKEILPKEGSNRINILHDIDLQRTFEDNDFPDYINQFVVSIGETMAKKINRELDRDMEA